MRSTNTNLPYRVLLPTLIACLFIGCHRHITQLEDVSKQVLRLARVIEKANEIHTAATGYAGDQSKTYKAFLQLSRKASTPELLTLTRHTSPAVRGYSFWALAKRKYKHLADVLIQHAADEEPVFFLQGCIGGNYPLVDIMSNIVSPNMVDLQCQKLSTEEFARLHRHRSFAYLLKRESNPITWPEGELQTGQRKEIHFDFSPIEPCTTRPCGDYGENEATFNFLNQLLKSYPEIELGIGVFSPESEGPFYQAPLTQATVEGIQQELPALGLATENILTLAFGSKTTYPNYEPIQAVDTTDHWFELLVIERGPMNAVEFDRQLSMINFREGAHTERLEDYLLACLAQLEAHRHEPPTYELFLQIYDEARNGPQVTFDPSWISFYAPENDWLDAEWDQLEEWERVVHELRSLTADLIHTREVRSRPGYEEPKIQYEWDTEGGVRFYNGTTPDAILGYAATRFVGEYSEGAFLETEVSWEDFTSSLWIGIVYE